MELLFLNPLYLWLLAPVPLFAAILIASFMNARKEIEKLISFHALEFFFKREGFIPAYIKKNFLIFMFRAILYVFIVFYLDSYLDKL